MWGPLVRNMALDDRANRMVVGSVVEGSTIEPTVWASTWSSKARRWQHPRETSGVARTRVKRGEREWPKEEMRGWDDDTSSVVDGCAEPSVDGMAPQESGIIAWRKRLRRRRARLAPSSRPILLWPWVTSPTKRSFIVANSTSRTREETNLRKPVFFSRAPVSPRLAVLSLAKRPPWRWV